ncbi:hypothetical protein HanIR_Chr16g0805531 [Helianthus annuus]|nr:hypothetical protein HanIR_Chr16g0805531 [Helianthus annuus]
MQSLKPTRDCAKWGGSGYFYEMFMIMWREWGFVEVLTKVFSDCVDMERESGMMVAVVGSHGGGGSSGGVAVGGDEKT